MISELSRRGRYRPRRESSEIIEMAKLFVRLRGGGEPSRQSRSSRKTGS